VANSGDEKRSSRADHVKGEWHLSRRWVSGAAADMN
jgi:hypothetical protein